MPAAADVVVIGGGITGVSTAYGLSRLGVRPVLLERGDLACGATGRNGGHFVFGVHRSRDGLALAVAAGRAIAEQIVGDVTLPIPQILRPERFS